MAKELPYFKFYCSEWNDGDITLEGYEVQGLYINICSWYWSRECSITIEQLKKKFASESDIIDYLCEINVLKNKNGNACISFLDEQLKERKKIAKRNKANGLKGGRPKTQSVKFGKPTKNPNITNIEEKRREEKREEDKEQPLPDFIDVDLWKDFLGMRKAIKKPPTERAIKSLINKLCNFEIVASGSANKSLEQSIVNNWQDVFEPKDSNKKKELPPVGDPNRFKGYRP